eukprot:CAMPEP_0183384310 /NCGR_PEP_ID=MMETSP0370-20130417/427_1 /TAXON_ID=268820 /ORGANISM="Peridinium aciculiferum, Strain PAER-2" /LENGTH=39 /DNA_ID= /DNA_START= /DNA_END= /DNA_ORIENTATION=
MRARLDDTLPGGTGSPVLIQPNASAPPKPTWPLRESQAC